jgi:hypothetical protein
MEDWEKELAKSKRFSKEIAVIREALKGWERPCKTGCPFANRGPCNRKQCSPEVARIKDFKNR